MISGYSQMICQNVGKIIYAVQEQITQILGSGHRIIQMQKQEHENTMCDS